LNHKASKQSQIIIPKTQTFLVNHSILSGFITTKSIDQKSHKVKTQRNKNKYPKNQKTHNLANDTTHSNQTTNNKEVNFMEKENQTIIQIKSM
jgi:hypothetical protein